jgi:hypothetical protein
MATINHPDFHAAVAGIAANPHDSLGYHALSDWLEEQGHGHEAHAIRFALKHQRDPNSVHAVHMASKDALTPGSSPSRFVHGVHIHANHFPNNGNYEDGTRPAPFYDHGVLLASPDAAVKLMHHDPTDKLIAEYQANRGGHLAPWESESRAAAAKRGPEFADAWDKRHGAIHELATHHEVFGNAEVAGEMKKLLKRAGFFGSDIVRRLRDRQGASISKSSGFDRVLVPGTSHVIFGNKPDPIYGTKGKVVRLSREWADTKDRLMIAVALHRPQALEMLIDHLIETGDPHGEALLEATQRPGGSIRLFRPQMRQHDTLGPYHPDEAPGEMGNGSFVHPSADIGIGYDYGYNKSAPEFLDRRTLAEVLPLFHKHQDAEGFANYLDHIKHPVAAEFRKAIPTVSFGTTHGTGAAGGEFRQEETGGAFRSPEHGLAIRFKRIPVEKPFQLSRDNPIPDLDIEEFGKGLLPWMAFADHLYEHGTTPHHQRLADAITYAIHHGNPYLGGPRITTAGVALGRGQMRVTSVHANGIMVGKGPHRAVLNVIDPTNVDPPVGEHIIRQYHRLFNPRVPDGEGHINIHKTNKEATEWAKKTGHPMIHPRVTFDRS